ncbi:MAG TPA: Crp/Fnr family transcriptional regulator [Candidatus Saccharimonadales bacterium]|nr:Crp/Fnr family transcriptional regulator [Candidatus Saccharimonadales bacterium]
MSHVSDKIHEYFSTFPKRSYDKGQILIFANQEPDYILYVTEGKVRQYDVSYRGDEIAVNIYKPPAFFPMAAVLTHTPNRYLFRTESKTTVHAIPPKQALAFLEANPDVTLDLLRRLYMGVDGLLGRMVQLMAGTAKSRLMYELLVECRRFGKQGAANSYTLTISEVDIAARSGLTRETVSREMGKIKSEGLVSLGHQGIHVPDITKLEQKLGLDT